jgi:predicted peroxiredoxin
LQNTVNDLPSGTDIDSSISDGISGLQEQIDALKQQLANVASEEDLNSINENLTGVNEDLKELLDSNNVFSGDIYIASEATLDFAYELGNRLSIVNGNVEIFADDQMDSVKLQQVIHKIKTVTGNFAYMAKNRSVATISFDSLIGATNLTVVAPHGLNFASLQSAGDILLGDNYDNKVSVVDFSKLSSVSSIGGGTVAHTPASTTAKVSGNVANAHTIDFRNADSILLGSLGRYDGNQLTIELDSGGTLDISNLDDVDATGEQTDLDLNITGAASVILPNYDDGDFTATDVETVELAKWKGDSGNLSLSGVTHIKLGAVETNIAIGTSATPDTDLETFDITAAKGDGSTDTAPTVAIYSSSVETVKIDGVTGNITLANSANLETATIPAKTVGTITLDNNASLVNVSLTGEAAGVVVKNNADLTSLTIGTTTVKSDAKNAKLDGVITVMDNPSLENLEVTSNDIEKLTVTGNSDLIKVDFKSLTKIGATGKPEVKVYGNDLEATRFTDEDDGTTNAANGASGDKGRISTTSGLDTLKEYLKVVAADADATAYVYFDNVDEFYAEGNSASPAHTNIAYNSSLAENAQADQITVLALTPGSGNNSATKAKRSWIIPSTAGTLQVTAGSPATDLFALSGVAAAVTISGNATLDVSNLITTENKARANAAGLTMTAQKGGYSTLTVSPTWYSTGASTATANLIGERYTNSAGATGAVSATNHGFGADEVITFKVGANTVTTTVAGGVDGSTASLTALVTAIETAYTAKYGATSTASSSAVASLTVVGATLKVDGLDPGSRGYGLAVSISVKAGTVTTTNAKALDWVIGSTRATTDNSTTSENIIFTLESNTAGTLAYVSTPTTFALTGTATPLTTSTQLVNGTDPNKGSYTAQMESRADLRIAEDSVTGTSGSAFSRIEWL